MKATVGRIVHYKEKVESEPLAAMVIGTYDDDDVDLNVFKRPTSSKHNANILSLRKVPLATDDGKGWAWPPREDSFSRDLAIAREVGVGDGTTEDRKKGFGHD